MIFEQEFWSETSFRLAGPCTLYNFVQYTVNEVRRVDDLEALGEHGSDDGGVMDIRQPGLRRAFQEALSERARQVRRYRRMTLLLRQFKEYTESVSEFVVIMGCQKVRAFFATS